MGIEELVIKFREKEYLISMGAGKLSKMFNCSKDDIKKVRELVKEQSSKYIFNKAKILIFDLETSPMISYTWGTWKQNVYSDQVIRDMTLMTYAAKWLGEDTILSGTAKESEDYDDFDIVSEMWSLLDEADIIVAHNLNKFDKKKINARFLAHGMTPPSPYKSVDTLTISKSNFANTYHKLDHLSKLIGSDGKMENSRFKLWKSCMEGDNEAWDIMLEYNKKDVIELEKVYLALRGWDSRHPSVSIYNECTDIACTKCGSTNLIYTKDVFTNTRSFKLYQCDDCKSWSRSRTSVHKSNTLMTQ